MKQIFSFLIWKVKKTDPIFALYLIFMIVYVTGVGLGYHLYANIFAIIVIFSILLKIIVYDNLAISWKEYKKEKENLMNTIKNSTKD